MLSDFINMTFWEYQGLPTVIAPDGHGGMCVFCGNGIYAKNLSEEDVKKHGKEITENEYDEIYGYEKYECEFVKLYLKEALSENDSNRMGELIRYIEFIAKNPIAPIFKYYKDENLVPIIEISNRLNFINITVFEKEAHMKVPSFDNSVYISKQKACKLLEYCRYLDNLPSEKFDEEIQKRPDFCFDEKGYVPGGILFNYKEVKKNILSLGHTKEAADRLKKFINNNMPGYGTDMSYEELKRMNDGLEKKYPPKKWWQIWE